eukprot:TRINITY_DN3512_c0_g1_i1.p1 TRINITY_DN3512_c0_g1~~TRINITY_DN3512_c0_g1_i1.p1  ORF type:complete len:473 (+),score=97.99 TRINITY_DN3512_c0_g1_i1:1540-2958(+)
MLDGGAERDSNNNNNNDAEILLQRSNSNKLKDSDASEDMPFHPNHNGGYLIPFWQIHWISLVLSFDYNVLTTIAYFIVVQRFEDSVIMYGVVLTLNSVMETVGAIVLGWWSDRRPLREPVLAALVAIVIGNVFHLIAFKSKALWLFTIGRLIAGIGGGGMAVLLAYITQNTSLSQRNRHISTLWLCNLSTNLWGPLICWFFVLLKLSNPEDWFNNLTAPALFTAFFTFCNIPLVVSWPNNLPASASVRIRNESSGGWTGGWETVKMLARSLEGVGWMCLYIKFVFSLGAISFSALASPLTGEDKTYEESNNAAIFLLIGSMIMFGVILAKLLSRKITDYKILIISQILVIIGVVSAFRWPADIPEDIVALTFLIAAIFLTIGNSMGITLTSSVFSKVIGKNNPHKGTLMGWLITTGSIGRCLAPVLSTTGLAEFGANAVFLTLAVLIALGFVGLVRFNARLARLSAEAANDP